MSASPVRDDLEDEVQRLRLALRQCEQELSAQHDELGASAKELRRLWGRCHDLADRSLAAETHAEALRTALERMVHTIDAEALHWPVKVHIKRCLGEAQAVLAAKPLLPPRGAH